MTLPIEPDPNLFVERPGDEIYAQVKEYLTDFLPRSAEIQRALVDVILEDVILDHAMSKALDDIGKILEYQAQAESIEKPKFFGLDLLQDAERLGKLKLVLRLCEVLGLDDESFEAVRQAEVDRLWGRQSGSAPRKGESLAAVIKELSKTINKKGATDGAAATGRPPRRDTATGKSSTHKGNGKRQRQPRD